MQTKYLNINEYKYKIEYIPYEECQSSEKCSKQFVMIRNFSLMNNIAVDDNIYFIEKQLFNQYINNCLVNKNDNDLIVFPSNKDTMFYSTSYHIYNDSYIDNDLINGSGVFELFEKKEGNIFDNNSLLSCDLIKIYHPINHTDKNMIIHIENVINNIHFHYLCNLYKNCYYNNQYNSCDESLYENNIYSEYIKCYIPNIRELFDRIYKDNKYDYKWYFKETINVADIVSDKNTDFIKDTIVIKDNQQYIPITLFTQSYALEEYNEDLNNNDIIEPDEKIFKKLYFKYQFSLNNSYITTPINISLYPYLSVNEYTNIYTLSDTLLPSTSSFLNEYKFSLASLIDFNKDGEISLICYFNYPYKQYFLNKYNNHALTEAYCFYNNIYNRYNIYKPFEQIKQEYIDELEEINNINTINEETIKFLIDSKLADKNPDLTNYSSKNDYYIQKLKESHWQVFLEEYIDEFKATIDFFGFKIEIASDNLFKNIILSENISLLNNDQAQNIMNNYLQDDYFDIFELLSNGNFFFPLTGIFTNWKQMPDIVVARITFIDRLIGQEIQSNEVFISKEKFKYITNTSDIHRLDQLTNINKTYNKDMIELNLNNGEVEFNNIIENITNNEIKNQLTNWFKTYVNDNGKFNFINNINCIITNENNQQTNYTSNKKSQNIIYKPIFFKTNTLNNVQIKYKQNQNIGIDLHEYLSKVDLFILSLAGNTYYEIGRNSNYVLFNINSSSIEDNSGTFEIYNNDHEYITYGTWSINV